MNRNDEYKLLLEQLEDTPLSLDFTLERARARRAQKQKKQRRRRVIFAPLGTLAAAFAAFALMVNVLPGFAYAAGRVPILRSLALAVAASPSLSAAVENQYVQPLELYATDKGITARVEYAIVDARQLHIFYRLESEVYDNLRSQSEISVQDINLEYSVMESYSPQAGDELRELVLSCVSDSVPAEMTLSLSVVNTDQLVGNMATQKAGLPEEYSPPEPIAVFTFPLSLDPYFTAQGQTLELAAPIELDGQTILLETVEIYPTHGRLVIDSAPENSENLVSLDFYVENQQGERFESAPGGLVSYGSGQDGRMIFMVESSFFSQSESLTLHITGAKWLSKSNNRTKIDLVSAHGENLPPETQLLQARQLPEGWELSFTAPYGDTRPVHQLFSWEYYDENGNKYELEHGISSTTDSFYDQQSQSVVDLPGRFVESFQLSDFGGDCVWLCPLYTRVSSLDAPVSCVIK